MKRCDGSQLFSSAQLIPWRFSTLAAQLGNQKINVHMTCDCLSTDTDVHDVLSVGNGEHYEW